MLPQHFKTLDFGGQKTELWCLYLDKPINATSLWPLLSSDEQARASRFHFAPDQRRFIIRRASLRQLLSRYIPVSPPDLRFSYNAYGKPSLIAPAQSKVPFFNMSHSADLVIYAINWDTPIGVDVEKKRLLPDFLDMANSYFAERELNTLRSLPLAQHPDAFFNAWTRKEAFIKAHGMGLNLPLNQFEVSLAPQDPAALLATHWNPAEVQQWQITAFSPHPDYIAALAQRKILT